MPQKVRYVGLEIASERLSAKLKRIAGAYRLGNLTYLQAEKEAKKAFDKTFDEVLFFTEHTIVQRDLGAHRGLISQQKSALKREANAHYRDFLIVLEAYRNA